MGESSFSRVEARPMEEDRMPVSGEGKFDLVFLWGLV